MTEKKKSPPKFDEINWSEIRKQFPVLNHADEPVIYLDSGASTQLPQRVIDRLSHYYSHDKANIHRGVYPLSERSTLQYEESRAKLHSFLQTKTATDIAFTAGTTASLNIVADAFFRPLLQEKKPTRKVILTTLMEHHANFIPWQRLAADFSLELKVVPVNSLGELDLDYLHQHLNDEVLLFAVTHVSNVLGTVNDVETLCHRAKKLGIYTIVDGAQSVAHLPINLVEMGCDFFAFSGHKMYGPCGIGGLYVREALHKGMHPYQVGGGIVKDVSVEKSSFQRFPMLLEAGTPSIADAIALGEAVDFLEEIGMDNIQEHEQQLSAYAFDRLKQIDFLNILGDASHRNGVFSFAIETIHPHDVASLLSMNSVAVRPGHSCALPLLKAFKVNSLTRVSLGCYNNEQDIDGLVDALYFAQNTLGTG